MPGRAEMAERSVLGLVGSPRRLGNCEVFIKEIFANLDDREFRLDLIRMPSLEIGFCRACYQCIMDEACPLNDDMDFLLTSIRQADAVIVTSPIYFLGAHSIYKQILDRGFLFYRHIGETAGKPAILVDTYGITDRIGTGPQTLMTFASFLCLDIKARMSIKAALPGEAVATKKNRTLARKAAQALFSPGAPRKGNGCPYCGCEIVRIKEKGVLICTVCHGIFTLSPEGRGQPVKEGPVLGPPDHMLLHKRWLQGMKQRFLSCRKESVHRLKPYRTIGQWLK